MNLPPQVPCHETADVERAVPTTHANGARAGVNDGSLYDIAAAER